jgi:4-hydroxybenzoate polyprenyltransferase
VTTARHFDRLAPLQDAPSTRSGQREGRVRALRAIIVSMRPRQWSKNVFVFAAFAFAGDLLDLRRALFSLAAFVLFCLLSGAVYIVNDLVDLKADRLHERKRTRPIAAGDLSTTTAAVAGASIGIAALAGAFAIAPKLGAVMFGYAVLQALYVLFLKKEVILDAMAISAGFVLRAAAGAVAIAVPASSWLLLCTFLLALFLALAKRRHEIVLLEGEAHEHRASLKEYTTAFIDSMLSTTAAAAIVAYALYTVSPTAGDHYRYLMATVPFVVYGVFRYLYLVHRCDLGGSPEEVLLSDVPLIVDIAAWAAVTGVIMYVLPS